LVAGVRLSSRDTRQALDELRPARAARLRELHLNAVSLGRAAVHVPVRKVGGRERPLLKDCVLRRFPVRRWVHRPVDEEFPAHVTRPTGKSCVRTVRRFRDRLSPFLISNVINWEWDSSCRARCSPTCSRTSAILYADPGRQHAKSEFEAVLAGRKGVPGRRMTIPPCSRSTPGTMDRGAATSSPTRSMGPAISMRSGE